MVNSISYACHILDSRLRIKFKWYDRAFKYCKGKVTYEKEAGILLGKMIQSGHPFAAGRIGLFEGAVMRMYEYKRKNKYADMMDKLYNCSGFFPNDISYGPRFLSLMKECLGEIDMLGSNRDACESYFINKYCRNDIILCKTFNVYDVTRLGADSWSTYLKGKRVLVVTPFTDSVRYQYDNNREKIYAGTDILPEFAELITYRSLMTIGDMNEGGFNDWFEALDYMKKEILDIDFDIALLGCGAYGFPLACEIKKAGRQAVHMGGALQLLFGIMGKRWDGSVYGKGIRADVAVYYNDSWIYPLEEKPKDADKVEYGPYWK